MNGRISAKNLCVLALLIGCSSKRDLGNLPDGGSGGTAGPGPGTGGQGGQGGGAAGTGGTGGQGLSGSGGGSAGMGSGGGGPAGGGGGAGGRGGGAGGGSGGAGGRGGGAGGGSGGAGGAPACRVDADCTTGPGVCLLSGVCATAADVIYVENTADLSICGNGNGTLQSPVCNVLTATSSFYLTSTRTTIIIRGAIIPFYIPAGLPPLLIVGRANGMVSGNSGAIMGITIYGGDVTIRNLGVTASGKGVDVEAMAGPGSTRVTLSAVTATGNVGAGVNIQPGTFVRMDGCLIQNNDFGISVADNAAFQIENTVIAGNSGKGVTLGATTASVATFRNNTVVGNNIGITCGAAYNITGSIVHGNGIDAAGLGPFAGCAPGDVCLTACSALDPMLDQTAGRYTLTVASPAACKDLLDTAPATDRKGTPRPRGSKSDCGADEYVP